MAHPPCSRWGRYWSGGPSPLAARRALGDDEGCFAAALLLVRRWGGVLEHPQASHAWRAFGLVLPPKTGGWISAGLCGGWTCCVEQGHYGHAAAKATWLYAHGVAGDQLPELLWGPSGKQLRIDPGYHSREERARLIKTGVCQRMSKIQRALTPAAFADVLIGIAATAARPGLAQAGLKT